MSFYANGDGWLKVKKEANIDELKKVLEENEDIQWAFPECADIDMDIRDGAYRIDLTSGLTSFNEEILVSGLKALIPYVEVGEGVDYYDESNDQFRYVFEEDGIYEYDGTVSYHKKYKVE